MTVRYLMEAQTPVSPLFKHGVSKRQIAARLNISSSTATGSAS